MSATAAQRHREGAFDLWRNEEGMVRCFHRDEECRGRLQAMHYIAAQTLKRLHGQAKWTVENAMYRSPATDLTASKWALRFRDTPLDTILADPRNSLVGCELHHGRFDRLGLVVAPPPAVIDFCTELGIEHLLPTGHPTTTERNAA